MYFFIVNPHSRSGRGMKIWKQLKVELSKRQVEYEAFLTEGIGHAAAIAKYLTEEPKEDTVLVAVGGDGTLNEVVDGIKFNRNIVLGYIPTGSGNDFSRSLKMPKEPVKNLNRILGSSDYKILDYGVLSYGGFECTNRRFAVSCGIGFDAEVCHEIVHSNLRRNLNRIHLGKLAYIMGGIKKLIQTKPSNGFMLLDDTKRVDFRNVLFISVHIHKYEGGGFAFAPKADPEDGYLDICAVSNLSRGRLILVLFFSLFGLHRRMRGVRIYRCKEIRVHTDTPMAVHTDGELCGEQTELLARCIEKKVKLIV